MLPRTVTRDKRTALDTPDKWLRERVLDIFEEQARPDIRGKLEELIRRDPEAKYMDAGGRAHAPEKTPESARDK